ncbi:MAG: phosphatase PAP2 family protein [Sinobacteraceae bacterium]|nr:phosphatase PAP2 family protein [Nevskiaceae bacterium]
MASRGEGQAVLATSARLRAHWRFKVLLPTGSIAVFFLAYFAVLRHPLWPVTVMPQTALDRLIPFQPGALFLYFTLWAYLSLPPGLLVSRRDLVFYYLGIYGLAGLGLMAFVLWPTAAPVPDIDWARYPSFGFLKTVDASGNACPSLHAAFAVFTAIWGECLGRECGLRRDVRAVNLLWGLAIVYSTLATKQHVAVDVYAGVALGALVAAVHIAAFRYARGRHAAACPAVA